MTQPDVTPDPWDRLRRHTPARIALGRAGGSLPTGEVLRFSMDHALARDAVWAELDVDRLLADVAAAVPAPAMPTVVLSTRAADRATYLKRPDLGRRLDDAGGRAVASAAPAGGCEVCLIVADGLSALAAQRQAPRVLAELVPLLRAGGWSVGPLVVVRQARVAVQDAIGHAVKARCAVTLIGERPGLGTPDSLGAYLVFGPEPGNTDADRNCVSNIRDGGLPPAEAARAVHYLVAQALARRLSGIRLKDDRVLSASLAPPKPLTSG
jgi:ethanolamine ammonia-lyase small subunit